MIFKNRKIISFCMLFTLLITSTAQLYASFSWKHTQHSAMQINNDLKTDHAANHETKKFCIEHCKSISADSNWVNSSTFYQFHSSNNNSLFQKNKQTISNI